MSEAWHPYTEPPSDTRSVILRFSANDAEIVVGFHSKDFNAYALSDRNARQLRFVHPTHWRELTKEERDEQ